MTDTPNPGEALTRVKIIEDFTDDDFGIIREPGGPRIEIAIAHDGAVDGVLEAERARTAITALPRLYRVLQEATQSWAEQFDGEDETDLRVSGADLLDWFAQWRVKAKAALADMGTATAVPAAKEGGDGS